MRRVFVCSPLRARAGRTLEENRQLAIELCRRAMIVGVAPFAPHVFYPLFLDDTEPEDRDKGMRAARRWLTAADEVWVFGRLGISEGMAAEIALAGDLGIKVVMDPTCWATVLFPSEMNRLQGGAQ